MKLIFISDLHLSPKTTFANQLFASLMQRWQNEIDGLYILGDFFDYWLGDDDDNEFISYIKDTLKSFSKRKPIYFIGGNHDFAIGKKFARETGITLLHDCSTITVNNNRILLCHGDVFCSLDVKYQRMKKVLQNPLLLFVLRRTPLKWRHKLKEFLENKSAESFNSQPHNTYHVVGETIIKIANKHKTNIVIHGHTHKPGRYVLNDGSKIIERFEIPDWAEREPGGYVLLDNDNLQVFFVK